MSSTHPNSPSECICAFLSITDGHILISHHKDLQSNFGASYPKSVHFRTWRSCPWLFSWPLPVSLKAEPQPTWTLHKQQWKTSSFFKQLVKLQILRVQLGLEFWNIVSAQYFTYPTFPIPLVGEGAGETGMKSILFGEKDFSDLSKSLSLCEYKVSHLTQAQNLEI